MKTICILALVGIVALQLAGATAPENGGPFIVAGAFFLAALAVAVHEALIRGRGVLGWIVNVLVAFAGAFLAAQAGGFLVVVLIGIVGQSGAAPGPLAATGGPVFALALAGAMAVVLAGSWGALQLVNRWR